MISKGKGKIPAGRIGNIWRNVTTVFGGCFWGFGGCLRLKTRLQCIACLFSPVHLARACARPGGRLPSVARTVESDHARHAQEPKGCGRHAQTLREGNIRGFPYNGNQVSVQF